MQLCHNGEITQQKEINNKQYFTRENN